MSNYKQIAGPIIDVLKKHIALSTESICAPVAKCCSNTPDALIGTHAWYLKVYKVANEMERRGLLVSAKVWNGKAYERVWRRK